MLRLSGTDKFIKSKINLFNWDSLGRVVLKVMIVGAGGQDGNLLTQISLQHGNTVIGIVHRSTDDQERVPNCDVLVKDFTDKEQCKLVLDEIMPDIIFHLAASHASSSKMIEFQENNSTEIYHSSVGISRNILSWQESNLSSRSVIALSSHMYSGMNSDHLVNEDCVPFPLTDYGKAKAETFSLIKEYRRLFGVNSCGAILFNHSSIFGRSDFIYPILANQICRVLLNKSKAIILKNFEARLDISDAEEICAAMYKMSQHIPLEDFVLGSGKAEVIREITLGVLERLNAPAGIKLISTEKSTHSSPVLISDIRKAKRILGWNPEIDAVTLLMKLVNQQLSKQQI
jgi:GDPmannose 4,6-dehydratase